MDKNKQEYYLTTILSNLSRKRKHQLILFSFTTFLSSFLEIFSLGAIFPFVYLFIDPSVIFNNEYIKPLLVFFEISEPYQIYIPFTLGFFILTTISFVLKSLLIYVRSKLSRIISQEISSLIYFKIINESYQFHTNQNSGDIIFGLTYSLNLAGSILIPILKILNSSLMLLFAIIGVFVINPLIAISVLGCVFSFYFITAILINNILKNISTIQNENYSNFIKLIQESLGAIKMIILNKSQHTYLKNYNKTTFRYSNSISKTESIRQLPRVFIEYLIIISVIVLSFILKENENIKDIIPLIITFILAFQKLLPEGNSIFDSITMLKSKKDTMIRVINYLKINKKSPYEKENSALPIAFTTKIELKQLNFYYTKDTRKILSDIDLTINKGQTVGIVGKTGSGKSTLIDLISGIISPNSGQIIVDDIPLDSSNIQGWKDKISLVSQDIFLFDATIEENIAFHDVDKKIDYEKLKEVCKMVELDAFIDSQPNGYQSKIGEKGIRISGGQMQRIGIARALYNRSEVLILDEATSALDEDTERKVMKNIIDYSQNLTLIIIAHRLTTLKQCNKIFKVETNGLKVFDGYTALIKNEKIEE